MPSRVWKFCFISILIFTARTTLHYFFILSMRLCSLAASRCSSLYGGADFLRSIIPSRRISFNPASSAPAHKSCSALRSPSAPAGSVRHPPIPERPACRSAYCAPAPRPAPQREISGGQFWVWERRGLLAAPWWVVFGFLFLAGQSGERWGRLLMLGFSPCFFLRVLASVISFRRRNTHNIYNTFRPL